MLTISSSKEERILIPAVALQGGWPSLDAPVFNAHPSYLNIEFDLYVPVRIQEQIFEPLGRESVGSEQFHIKCWMNWRRS